jgi:hypothetical protein
MTIDQIAYTALAYRLPQFIEAVRDMADIVPPQLLDELFAQLRNDLDDIQAEFEEQQAAAITAPAITWSEPDCIDGYTGEPGRYHIVSISDEAGKIASCSIWQGNHESMIRLGGARTVDGAKAFAERHAQTAVTS